ncbi:hypothetical protein [Xanthobacter agilis]|uniref:Uncharacterized protein n=1 Tax=Xanthobacter agilis TaxID=47492 RepID=A0ABU0LAM6_XANAG|nr:hypothetical protein [Xanthobacter agilis]MDQ0504120.1 hypothetical protein [Xanthobacter agilis]
MDTAPSTDLPDLSESRAAIYSGDYERALALLIPFTYGTDPSTAIVKAQIALVQWLIGGVGFGVLLLIIKSFWPAA